jgi:hypothetical protein
MALTPVLPLGEHRFAGVGAAPVLQVALVVVVTHQ